MGEGACQGLAIFIGEWAPAFARVGNRGGGTLTPTLSQDGRGGRSGRPFTAQPRVPAFAGRRGSGGLLAGFFEEVAGVLDHEAVDGGVGDAEFAHVGEDAPGNPEIAVGHGFAH